MRHPVQFAVVGLSRIIFLKYTISVVENNNITSVFGLGLENLVSASALASSFWPQLKHLASFTISGWRGGLVVGRSTCDLVVAGSRPGRDAAA